MEYAMRTRGLTKRFGAFQLGPVDLDLPGGAVMGLIGENGAGKSTFLKCLTGSLHPTAGTAELLGLPARDAMAQVGYVPDECPFAGVLKVEQVGRFAAGFFPTWDAALFADYLKKFDLPGDKKVRDLSRGMGMKLTIAAALAHRPKLLLLDEATAGLDPVVRDEILEEFLSFVSDDDHAVLISSHITSDLEKVCDYVTYLHQGKVTITGEKDALLDTYARIACARAEAEAIDLQYVVGRWTGSYGCEVLVNDRTAVARRHPHLVLEKPTLEDLMIFTTRGERA